MPTNPGRPPWTTGVAAAAHAPRPPGTSAPHGAEAPRCPPMARPNSPCHEQERRPPKPGSGHSAGEEPVGDDTAGVVVDPHPLRRQPDDVVADHLELQLKVRRGDRVFGDGGAGDGDQRDERLPALTSSRSRAVRISARCTPYRRRRPGTCCPEASRRARQEWASTMSDAMTDVPTASSHHLPPEPRCQVLSVSPHGSPGAGACASPCAVMRVDVPSFGTFVRARRRGLRLDSRALHDGILCDRAEHFTVFCGSREGG